MRGISGAFACFAVGVLGVVAGLVVTLAVPRTLDGAAVAAAPAEATEDPYPDVVPLATTPTPRWTVSMSDIDVPADTPDAKSRRPAVLAANTSIVVGGPRQVTETALMAFDATTGKKKWPKVSDFRAEECAFSRDGRLACIRRGADRATSEIGFIDAGSGQVTGTRTIAGGENPTGPALVSAGKGFLVTTKRFVHKDAHYALTLTWFSSDGSRTWEHKPPPGFDDPALSEAGNVVAVRDFGRRVQVYALDSGDLVYDSTEDLKNTPSRISSPLVEVAPVRSGFAVSIRGDAKTVTVYDSKGTRRGVIEGVVLAFMPQGSEGDLIPVEGTDDDHQRTLGVASTVTFEVVAATPSRDSVIREEILGERFLVGLRSGRDEDWLDFDTQSPTRTRSIAAGPTVLLAFDGTRGFFADRAGSNSGVPYLFACDLASGRQVWEIGNAGGEEREYEFVGPYLMHTRSGDAGQATISSLGA